jgi:hypothetical protein
MKVQVSERDVENMRQQLEQVRRAWLKASQRGDFRAVGRLTTEAPQLNQSIKDAQGILLQAA